MQTIIVCTDAGHRNYHKKSVATWAAYIRTPSQTIKSSGIINKACKGSSNAELYAIANALHVVARSYDITKYKLIIYSDSKYALMNHIDNSLISPKDEQKEVYNNFIRPHIEKALVFEARHVKAHLPKSQWGEVPARFFMQDWCDSEVRRVMKVAIEVRNIEINNKLVFLRKKEHN